MLPECSTSTVGSRWAFLATNPPLPSRIFPPEVATCVLRLGFLWVYRLTIPSGQARLCRGPRRGFGKGTVWQQITPWWTRGQVQFEGGDRPLKGVLYWVAEETSCPWLCAEPGGSGSPFLASSYPHPRSPVG